MRRLLLALTSAAFTVSAGSAFAADDTFTASATTQAGIAVSCTSNLAFGTLGVEVDNTESTVVVDASSGATATVATGTGVTALGTSNPAECTVTNETDGDATATLSSSTATLEDASSNTLAASNLTLSSTDNIVTDTTLYVGGTLTIPATHTTFGAYTSPAVTVTVTD